MTKEQKNQVIDELVEVLQSRDVFYLVDTQGITVAKVNQLRRTCFQRDIGVRVVKNTLLKKAMERSGKDFSEIFPVLHGTTALFTSETGNAPAKLLKEFRKVSDKVVLKGAYVESAVFIGENQLENLISIKSREELIADIVAMLQSPINNVVGALRANGDQGVAGLVKALEERAA